MQFLLEKEEQECLMDVSIPCLSAKLVILSVILWVIAAFIIKYCTMYLGNKIFATVDPSKCYLPDYFPLPQQRGTIKPWTRCVLSVEEQELDKFLTFRNVKVEDLSINEKQKLAAAQALKYRNELFDENILYYHEAHFLKHSKAGFPIMMKTWNESAFFAEMGPVCQSIWCGGFTYAVHHAIGGFLALYALHYDLNFVRLVCYNDIGLNLADLIAIVLSNYFKMDLSFYSGMRRMDASKGDYSMNGFFKVLVFHHIGASSIEAMALYGGTDPVLMAEGGLAMLGTTGLVHFASVLSDCMPIREYPRERFIFTAIALSVFMYWRGYLWITKFIPELLVDTYSNSGLFPSIACAIFLCMFTKINADFIQLYVGKTKKLYQAYTEELATAK